MPAQPAASADALQKLAAAYKRNPGDKSTIIYYAAALRANGQNDQAVAVLEGGIAKFPNDPDILVGYAKALSAAGRFEQALNVVDDASIRPHRTGMRCWSRAPSSTRAAAMPMRASLYGQALMIAPDEASIDANLGLSYAMTNELDQAEPICGGP